MNHLDEDAKKYLSRLSTSSTKRLTSFASVTRTRMSFW